MLGRAFGTRIALAQAGIPLGAVLVGVLIERAGLIPTIVGMGILYVAATVTLSLNPALRGINTRPGESATD
jgi:predicted MFS family arabinose efflux permease